MILQTAQSTLLAPFDLEAGKLERVFGELGARRIDYADLYFQYARSEGWSLEEGIVKSASFNIEQGVGVRAVAGDKTAFAYSDEISFDALQDAVVFGVGVLPCGLEINHPHQLLTRNHRDRQFRAHSVHLHHAATLHRSAMVRPT